MMASATEALYRTDVLAVQDRQAITSSTAEQWTDVFGRRERRATAATEPRQRRLRVELAINDELIEFTFTGSGSSLPAWVDPVFSSLSDRWGASPRWDSYRAKPTDPTLAVKLLNILSGLMEDSFLFPQITPLADGGVQAEWHTDGRDLEIVVSRDEPPTYYFFDRASGDEEDAVFEPGEARVRALIGGLD